MSTSGTYAWKMSAQSLVNAALRKLAVLSGGTLPETYEVTNAVEALNGMLVGFQAHGLPLWKMTTYQFNTVANTQTYSIGQGATLNTVMPLKITQAWRSTSAQANIPMNIYTDYNFNLLPVTAGPATPVNLYYQPGEFVGTINIWPKPLDASNAISIRYQSQYTDIVALTDEIDFPRYWYEAVIYGLAVRMAPEYGIPLPDRQALAQQAEMFKQEALSFGQEEGSLYFQPDWSGR